MTKPNMKTKASVFSMGQRSEVLSTDLEAPILVPHALEKTSTRVNFIIQLDSTYTVLKSKYGYYTLNVTDINS